MARKRPATTTAAPEPVMEPPPRYQIKGSLRCFEPADLAKRIKQLEDLGFSIDVSLTYESMPAGYGGMYLDNGVPTSEWLAISKEIALISSPPEDAE